VNARTPARASRFAVAGGLVVALLACACGGDDHDATEVVFSTTTTVRPSGPSVGASLVPTTTASTSTLVSTTTASTSTLVAPTAAPPATRAPTSGPPPFAPPPPAPTVTQAPPPPAPPPGGPPASLLDLTHWKITLPIADADGDALEIRQPQLASYADEFFHRSGGGVAFTAPVTGATTSGSSYPRSELREMTDGGSRNASWSSTSGRHVMEITQMITQTPVAKPHVVAGQIHDAGDDVVMVRLEGRELFVEAGGDRVALLDGGYVVGTSFTVRIEAGDGNIRVAYNGAEKVVHPFAGDGLYFKAGVYTQSNATKGEPPGAAGQVIITALHVSHS
jgi:poly(beta-D-mannuronate) lyase